MADAVRSDRPATPGPIAARRAVSYAFRLLAAAIAYFLLAKSGLAVASVHPSATPIWPATGLAIAVLLLWGHRFWPAIYVAALIANLTTAGNFYTAAAIAAGNTLEALLIVWLVARWSDGRSTFETPAGVARFALIAAFSGTLISAGIGVGALHFTGYAAPADLSAIWITWWLGDVAGALVVAPVIVLWVARGTYRPAGRALLAVGALYALACAVGIIAFSPPLHRGAVHDPLAFLAIVPLMWAAFRGQRDTATAALILCAFAVWGAVAGAGPFAPSMLNEKFLLLLSFVVSATVPSLALSAAIAVRQKAEERQSLVTAELDHRVRNILATIQATARLTARSTPNKEAYARALDGRIAAMARTHALLSRAQWQGARLPDLLADELHAYASAPSCFTVAVPDCTLHPRQALNLALIVHELATNAAKYGALSQRGGRVVVSAAIEGSGAARRLLLHWQESGGPPVAPSTVKGFGTQLFARAAAQDDASVAVDFAPQGVCCRIDLPLSS